MFYQLSKTVSVICRRRCIIVKWNQCIGLHLKLVVSSYIEVEVQTHLLFTSISYHFIAASYPSMSILLESRTTAYLNSTWSWCLQVELSCCGQSINPIQPVHNLMDRWLRVGPSRHLQTSVGSSGGEYVMVITYGRPKSWAHHVAPGDLLMRQEGCALPWEEVLER